MAHAKPKPSEVEVPRPNSSIIIKEFLVPVFNMQEASSISDIKVEIPRSCISLAPTLVINASIIGISAESHGTKHPKKSNLLNFN